MNIFVSIHFTWLHSYTNAHVIFKLCAGVNSEIVFGVRGSMYMYMGSKSVILDLVCASDIYKFPKCERPPTQCMFFVFKCVHSQTILTFVFAELFAHLFPPVLCHAIYNCIGSIVSFSDDAIYV